MQIEGAESGIQPPTHPPFELLDLFRSRGRIREVVARDLFEKGLEGHGLQSV